MRAIVFVLLFIFTAPSVYAQAVPAATPSAFDEAVGQSKSNMMADPPAALAFAQSAETRAADPMQVATAQWLQGEALNRMNRPADAAPVINEALASVEAAGGKVKLYGDLLVARAGVARAQGDYATALSSFQSAHEVFLTLEEDRAQAMALLNIASIYTDARDYARALKYFELAGDAYGEDPSIDLSRRNNIAMIHQEMGELGKAETEFASALEIAREMESPMLQTRILTNLAAVQLADGRIDAASTSLNAGFEQAAIEPSGWEPFLYGMKARIAFARGQSNTAQANIEKAYAGEDLTQTIMPFREFHDAANQIYSAAGKPELALAHLRAFKRLDDEARNVSAAANMALMGAQFDFANQELKIANLRAETLEKEVALQRAKARQRMVFLGGTALVILIILSGGIVHYLSMRRSRDRVRDANAQLSQSNNALEKALKAKSEFLATTSHEIRTPLNGILGMTQILMRHSVLTPEVRERVELVHASGEAMKAIVDDILDVAKLESGVITIDDSIFDLKATLGGVLQVWRDSAAGKGLPLVGDLDLCPGLVRSDVQRVRQIVFNLLSNAVKFTDHGEIRVVARRDDTGQVPGLVIEVRDTGCGIPADQLDLIFEPFHQVDGGKTRQHSGTGLGLSICRKLAQALGGEVTVLSAPGEGSVFTMRLPLNEVSSSSNGSSGQNRRLLLLLDSNLLNQSLLEGMLEDDDVEIVCAETAEEALVLMASRAPSSVFVNTAALSDEPGSAMEQLMSLCEQASEAHIVALLHDNGRLEAAMLRLAGVSKVLAGPFDAFNIAAFMSPEPDNFSDLAKNTGDLRSAG